MGEKTMGNFAAAVRSLTCSAPSQSSSPRTVSSSEVKLCVKWIYVKLSQQNPIQYNPIEIAVVEPSRQAVMFDCLSTRNQKRWPERWDGSVCLADSHRCYTVSMKIGASLSKMLGAHQRGTGNAMESARGAL